jgi:hypothetical protein
VPDLVLDTTVRRAAAEASDMRDTLCTDTRGFGLLTVLLWLSLLMTTALGVALATSAEPPATSALQDRLRLARAAESAVSLAIAALAAQPDWSLVPGAGVASPFTDGVPGPRVVAGMPLDLVEATHQRTCGRTAPCDDAATSMVAPGRPWGVRNPRWRLVVHLPLADIDAVAARACPCYLIAWVADDPADDGDPARDAPPGCGPRHAAGARGGRGRGRHAGGGRGAVAQRAALELPCEAAACDRGDPCVTSRRDPVPGGVGSIEQHRDSP